MASDLRYNADHISDECAKTRKAVSSRDKAGHKPLLTSRQEVVLHWVVQGKTNSEIGQILNLSADTIRQHVMHIARALGVYNRVQVAALAATAGLSHFVIDAEILQKWRNTSELTEYLTARMIMANPHDVVNALVAAVVEEMRANVGVAADPLPINLGKSGLTTFEADG